MKLKNRKGTSIIEAAVAIALISIMLLWAAKLYTNSSKNVVTTGDIEIATQLASNKIESLKKLDRNGIDGISTSSITQFSSPYDKYGYKYVVPNSVNGETNPRDTGTVYIKYIEVDVYLMSDTSKPIIKMECNFLRKDSDGTNLGL